MSKIKKLYTLSEESIQRIQMLQVTNPNLSASEIVDAIIMTTPSDASINVKKKVEYTISKQ